LALADHDEQEGRPEEMVGSLVDQDDIMPVAEFPAEVGSRDHSSTAAAQNNDLFPSVECDHLLFTAVPLLPAQGQTLDVPQSLLAPELLFAAAVTGEFRTEACGSMKKPEDDLIG